MKPLKVDRKDWKFVPKNPDIGFSAEHNKRIIDEVIEETDKVRKRKLREHDEKLKERTDAVAQYLHNIAQGSNSSILKYFGRKHLAYLRGKEIMQEIQKNLTIVKDGKIIKKAGD